MPAVRKSKAKAKHSPSASEFSVHSLEAEEDIRNRKRLASEPDDLESETFEIVHASPTKKYKRTSPGSPEYESQPAVVVTAKHGRKPLRRKLSFGFDVDDEADKVSEAEDNALEDEEASLVENVQRSRKLSQKAAYMADTPTRKHKEHVHQRSPVKNRAARTVVLDTPAEENDAVNSPIITSPEKMPVPRTIAKKPAAARAVKQEQASDVDLSSAYQQPKGKAPARLGSPIDITDDESGSDRTFDTPKAKGRPSGTIPKALEKDQRTPQVSVTTAAMADMMKDDLSSPTASGGEKNTGVIDAPSIQLCTIRPTDSSKTSAYAPADLRDPDTDKPIFLQSHLLASAIEEPMLLSLMASLSFESLPPFVNPSNYPSGELTISDYRNVIWPGSKDNAVCMMFGAVHSCNIIHYAMAGPNKIRALTIIPTATAFDSFCHFLWKQYAALDIYGPFDYGCLLTFTSRREGLSSSYGSSQPKISFGRPKRNMKLFGSSATAPPATHWYEKNFPPFLDYDQEIPIYDASTRPFLFMKEDFAALPTFPRYTRAGDRKYADVPVNGLVSVFFGMNTYSNTRVPPTPGSSSRSYHDPQTPVASGSGSSSRNDKATPLVLSLNLQFVIYHGQLPEADEDD